MNDIEQSRLPESAKIGFQCSGNGTGNIVIWGILRIMNLFGEDSKLENLKQDISDLYTIQFINQDTAKLRLKQYDY